MPFRSFFCIDKNNLPQVHYYYAEIGNINRLKLGILRQLANGVAARRLLTAEKRNLQTITTQLQWKQKFTAAAPFFITQTIGARCGFSSEATFLQDSDPNTKDCTLSLTSQNCSTADLVEFNAASIHTRFQQAFNVTPIETFILSSANPRTSTTENQTSVAESPTNTTCRVSNYPRSVRAIFIVNNDRQVQAIRLLVYLANIS